MPIGKNSIKRVANNGYSSVKTEAPDMENSSVLSNPAPEVMEMAIAMAEKKPKKASAKKSDEAKRCKRAAAPEKPDECTGEFIYFGIGEELPTYLL